MKILVAVVDPTSVLVCSRAEVVELVAEETVGQEIPVRQREHTRLL